MRKGSKVAWTTDERANRSRSISAGMQTGAPAVSEEEKARRTEAISQGIIALGFTPLETTYLAKEDVQLQCRLGHLFRRSFQYLQKSQVCPWCLPEQEARRRQAEIEVRLDGTGIRLVDTIVPGMKNVRLLCGAGHTFSRKIHHVMHNPTVCDSCTREARKREVRETAGKNGIEVIAYDGAYMDHVTARCPKGHEILVLYQGIERGLWCVTCNGSFAEDDFARRIESIVGRPLVRNSRTVIAPAELDIYDPVTKTAIEYCGLYYHSTAIENNTPNQHADKLKACREVGIRLLTVFEDEWLEKPEIVLDRIRHAFGATTIKMDARKLTVREVDAATTRAFFDAQHIQGHATQHMYAVGLYDGDRLVQCMSLGKPSRAHVMDTSTLELKRLAALPGTSVRGGAARLFRRLTEWAKENGYKAVKSYCDLRYGTGGVYDALGFRLVATSKPSYWYVKSRHRYSAISKRKTPEERLTGLKEHELREQQGYFRIWDCGHQAWVIDLK